MANVTLVIDDDTLRRARIHALQQGTSLNGLVREYLESLVGGDPSQEAARRFIARAKCTPASSGAGGRTWTRDELYNR
jgi:hypothetical protein